MNFIRIMFEKFIVENVLAISEILPVVLFLR